MNSCCTCHSSSARQASLAAPAAAATVLHRQLYSLPLSPYLLQGSAKRQRRCSSAAEAASTSSNSKETFLAGAGQQAAAQAASEHIFSAEAAQHFKQGAAGPIAAAAAAGQQDGAEPWGVGWQLDEQNLLWNDDIKMRFVQVRHSTVSFEDRLLGHRSNAW
jgi:hypothetical protein